MLKVRKTPSHEEYLNTLNQLRELIKNDKRFNGMSEEEVISELRKTRERLWNEQKHKNSP